jgi:murein DD-endopeptidase MepM/ murein hydrolase activator NlpD
VGAIAGTYLIIALRDSGAFVALAHMRAGSMRVAIGEEVTTGQPVADCGNSGNSTQPHVHVQVWTARTCPLREASRWRFGASANGLAARSISRSESSGLPGESAVVQPLPVLAADVGP